MNRTLLKIGMIASGVIPYFAHAQNYIGSNTTGTPWGSIKDIVEAVGKFINGTIMPLLVIMALVYFFWNLIHFIRNMSNEKEREVFKVYTINALIGLFIMLSVWGIVAIGTQTFFNAQPIVPQLRTSANGGTTAP